jgi:hypothetical protein
MEKKVCGMAITLSLSDVHKMNAKRAGLAVRMLLLQNRWTNLDEIWYGLYSIEGCHTILLFHFL